MKIIIIIFIIIFKLLFEGMIRARDFQTKCPSEINLQKLVVFVHSRLVFNCIINSWRKHKEVVSKFTTKFDPETYKQESNVVYVCKRSNLLLDIINFGFEFHNIIRKIKILNFKSGLLNPRSPKMSACEIVLDKYEFKF